LNDFRALIVDDETDFLDTLLKRMRKRHLEVFGAETGEEALRLLDEQSVDVVVLDVRLPGMDGLQTLKAIKQRAPLTEVLLLTGHACLETARCGMEQGAFDYLMKPIDIDELLFKLQDAYKHKQLQEKKIQALQRARGQNDAK
jgi:DNA-binding NtrC family response regulator